MSLYISHRWTGYVFTWLGFVWIRWGSKAISDVVKGHCSRCIKRQWLLVIILTAWASSSPLLPLLSIPITFTFTPSFLLDHHPKHHQNGFVSCGSVFDRGPEQESLPLFQLWSVHALFLDCCHHYQPSVRPDKWNIKPKWPCFVMLHISSGLLTSNYGCT